MTDANRYQDELARQVSELLALVRGLLGEQQTRHLDSPAVRAVTKLLTAFDDDDDVPRHPELVSALRWLVALGGDGDAIERARAWITEYGMRLRPITPNAAVVEGPCFAPGCQQKGKALAWNPFDDWMPPLCPIHRAIVAYVHFRHHWMDLVRDLVERFDLRASLEPGQTRRFKIQDGYAGGDLIAIFQRSEPTLPEEDDVKVTLHRWPAGTWTAKISRDASTPWPAEYGKVNFAQLPAMYDANTELVLSGDLCPPEEQKKPFRPRNARSRRTA